MQKILHDTPANPSQLNPLLPPPIDWVVQKALAKEPDDRFQTAREFQAALFSALPDSVTAHPTTDVGAPPDTLRTNQGLLNAARKLRTLSKPGDAGSTMRPQAAPVFAPEPAPLPQRPRVLFVDDEERILNALKNIFRSRYHVLTAANGQEALEFIKKFRIPVIVSDQRMPGMLGVELLRRARELSPDSVRILLTGYSDLASIVGSINDGEVYRFISKPWDNQELQKVIAEAVAIGNRMLERPAAQVQLPASVEAAILVLDERRDVYGAIDKMAGQTYDLVHVKTIQEALNLLEAKEVALLVADIDMEAENYLLFFNLLKRKYPEVLTIVLTSASDSELVIHLINEAQIFRFLNKPVSLSLMHQYIHSALGRYVEFKNSPALLERHRVPESHKANDSAFGQGLRERLRSLSRLVG
jgi:serine/threonine-protein kinase